MLFARHTARFAGLGIPDCGYFRRQSWPLRPAFTARVRADRRTSVRRSALHPRNTERAAARGAYPLPDAVLQTQRYELDDAYPGLFGQVEQVARPCARAVQTR